MRQFTKLMLTAMLLVVGLGGSNSAKAGKAPGTEYTSVSQLSGKAFAIVNKADGKAVYHRASPSPFTLGYENYGTAFAAEHYLFKIEVIDDDGDPAADGKYLIRCVNKDGSNYDNNYLQTNSSDESFIYALNFGGNQRGLDGTNTAVWDIEYVAEKGWTIKNVGKNGYYNDPTKGATYETPAYFAFCDVKESADQNVEITVGGETRNYQLYVPGNAVEDCPLVISLHGAGGHSTDYSPFRKDVANEEGCIVAYPQGKDIYFPVFGGNVPGWDASGEVNEDVEFLKAVIEDVASKYQIDRKRIYCCGFSNGGMMTYAMANACSDKIAAFASISGYPLNEFHLRHAGERPVPFLHIHGKADDFVLYAKMPTIVDEMVARNGANPVPTTTSGSGYTKNVYAAADSSFPYIYYEIDGMGHNDYTDKTEDGSSVKTMWKFFEQYTLDSPCDKTLKWAPRIEEEGYTPAEHGWTKNSGTTLLQFGGNQNTADNKNVYYSLQFNSGKYNLSFTSTGAAGKSIGVKIEKLTSPNTVVLNTTVNVGANAELSFSVTDGWGEYKLTMTRPEASDAITITNIVIKQAKEEEEEEDGAKTPVLLLKNGAINTTDFNITPIAPSTLTTDNLYAATFTSKATTSNVFQYQDLDVKAYEKAVIKYSITDANEWRINTPIGHYALPSGTNKTYEIDLSGVDTYSDFTIFSSYQNHTVGSSITISKVYLVKSSITSDTKTLPVDLSALPESSENTTWVWDGEKSTGTFVWSATWFNSTELFGAGNYSAYTTLNLVTAAGTADHFRIIVKFTNGTGQLTIDPVKVGTQSITLLDYMTIADLANVQTIRLSGANDGTGDITVSSIYLEGPDVVYIEATEFFEAPAGTTDMNGMTGPNTTWNISYPKEIASETTWCGNIDSNNEAITTTDYDFLHFVVSSASDDAHTGLRVFVWDGSERQCLYPRPIKEVTDDTDWKETSWISSPGTYVVKVSGYDLLRGFKALQSWAGNAGLIVVSQAYFSSGSPVDYTPTGQYTLVGEVTGSASLSAALADDNATCFDATGVTGTDIDLTSVANPNALFKTNAGVLANTNNVIVDGVCANLVLADDHPFKAPEDFTATAASYTTTINPTAQCGTLCLPFAATVPDGVTAYTLSYTSGDNATAMPVDATIPANKPVLLLNGSGEKTFSGSSVAIDADASNISGTMTGVFQESYVPQDSYVLQDGDSGIGFYKVEAENTITIKPFRAYLSAAAAGGKDFLSYDFLTTGIEGVNSRMDNEPIFNLAGQRLSKLQKGVNIVNGKKFIVR